MFALNNCNHFFRTRPPLVIFLVCLVCLMLASFSFTFYVNYTDKITNSDVKQNWLSLKQHLGKQRLCFGDARRKEELKSEFFVFETTFTTTVTLNLTQFQNVEKNTQIEGLFDLHGWQSLCQDDYVNGSLFVSVRFTLPRNNASTVCATVKGPKRYLPEDSLHCNTSVTQEKLATLFTKPGYCSSPTNPFQVQLLFDSNNFTETYLSDSDKNLIFGHLVWLAYILLFFIMVVLLYALSNRHESQLNTFS